MLNSLINFLDDLIIKIDLMTFKLNQILKKMDDK